MSVWLLILAAVIMLVASGLGILLTLVTLPGVWVTLLAAVICQFAFGEPALFSWWTLGGCAALAFAAEVFELFSSAAGAAKSGGGRSGAIGSVIGAIVGAILGSFIIPIVGTVIGAVVGAGGGAIMAERGIAGRSWNQSLKIGQGAAVGRFAALIVKTAVAAAIGVVLVAAAVIR
jgi:hypothetical protein